MKAKHILVFWVGPHVADGGEAKTGAKKLYLRLVTEKKAHEVQLIRVPQGATAIANLRCDELTTCVPCTHDEGGTAIYIISHHTPFGFPIADFGGILASTFATLIRDYVAAGELEPVTKIALLACRAATPPVAMPNVFPLIDLDNPFAPFPTSAPATSSASASSSAAPVVTTDDGSLLQRFCKELAYLGIKPKIAGWESFVTVCYEANPALKAGAKLPEFTGRKSSRDKKRPTDANDRMASKKIVQWDDTLLFVGNLTLAGWTQKPPN
jgi:hypothetical protein